ncbi:hypothetical protein [Streptomyces zagrosensis]|uniref:Uncharacterized protein n=1 Tax=Streptomyces zagrosensis TaxID=1042984 RepID=A0A7W9Q8G0_9ACTN|nr:hypothetical protein [Streptomyces zagrosensis]MBB5935539.1 hypothetical protein [Streptomyces zagrosensis]
MPVARGVGGANDRVCQELRQALRSGPFSAALNLAIEASGLTLEELQLRLMEEGVRVSVPTLSYWRRGRSRPERPTSLQAVRVLEGFLTLPPDSLLSLLGPRRLRGRWIGHLPGRMDAGKLFGDARPIDLLHSVGVPMARGALRRISTHVTVSVAGDRQAWSIRLRELVQANADRVSRCGVVYVAEEQPDNPAALGYLRECRVGRVQVDQSAGVTAAELILDRVLNVGERALVEYEWCFPQGVPMVNYEHRFAEPIREFVLQVRFAPSAVPAECRRYDRRTVSAPEGNLRELWIGSSDTALLAESDVPAGIVGMRWAWPAVPVRTEEQPRDAR